MPSLGIGTLVFLVVQIGLAALVYRRVNASAHRSPALVATIAVVVGIGAALALGGVLEVVLGQLVLVALLIGLVPSVERRPS